MDTCACELHDAVGHDVSLMVVQAQALGATAADEQVREGAEAIAELGRRTMGEMHRTLRLLRDENATRAPQPGLDASEATVKSHVSNLLGKLGLRDRVQP